MVAGSGNHTVKNLPEPKNQQRGLFDQPAGQARAERLILHVDIDAFFASVEQLLIPALRNRPVIVGSGVIASCSYEARRFGLAAGMSLHKARRLCPSVVVLDGQYPIYRCFAEHVWSVSRRFVCGLETFLDEGYGDATGMGALHGDPLTLGRKLRDAVRGEVSLPVSVGLGANRMMAKIASSSAKPAPRCSSPQVGVVWIRPGCEQEFLANLPIEKLPGVGRKTGEKLRDMNIETVGQLRTLPLPLLRTMFGRRGELLYERSRGRESRIIRPAALPKTISRETTFHEPLCDRKQICGMLFYLLQRAARTVRKHKLLARCVELTIRYDDWTELSAAKALPYPTDDEKQIFPVVLRALKQLHQRRVALRHVGVVLSRFTGEGQEGELFTPPVRLRRRRLCKAVDTIRDRWGHAAIVSGASIELLGRMRQNDYGFVLRTPSLTK